MTTLNGGHVTVCYFYKCFLISTHFSYFRHVYPYSRRPELLYILDKRIPCYQKVVGRAACNFRDRLEDIHHNISLHLLYDISSNRNRYYHPKRNFKNIRSEKNKDRFFETHKLIANLHFTLENHFTRFSKASWNIAILR